MRTAKPKHWPTPLGTTLNLKKRDFFDLQRQIDSGLPYAAVTRFQKNSALPLESIHEFIGVTTAKTPRRLTPLSSERLLRLVRVFEKVLDVFEGDTKGAAGWLQYPAVYFLGATPLSVAKSELGAREVEDLIGRIDYGIYT